MWDYGLVRFAYYNWVHVGIHVFIGTGLSAKQWKKQKAAFGASSRIPTNYCSHHLPLSLTRSDTFSPSAICKQFSPKEKPDPRTKQWGSKVADESRANFGHSNQRVSENHSVERFQWHPIWYCVSAWVRFGIKKTSGRRVAWTGGRITQPFLQT